MKEVLFLLLMLSDLAVPKQPTQYASHPSTSFERLSVEAPPDVIEDTVLDLEDSRLKMKRFHDPAHLKLQDDIDFQRGAVESGTKDHVYRGEEIVVVDAGLSGGVPLKFYGAASHLNGGGNLPLSFGNGVEVFELEDSGEETYPVRESVEQNPRKPTLYYDTRQSGGSGFYGQNSKVVCYFSSWAVERPSPMNFSPADLDPNGCTHVIYGFAEIDEETYEIRPANEERDVTNGLYLSATALKRDNPDLKVMIGVGGWRDGGKKYSEMSSSTEARKRFIDSVVAFVGRFKFDGLDMNWEYPGSRNRDGKPEDKKNFVMLMKELREAFDEHDWILSAAVSSVKERIDAGYDVKGLSEHVDFFNVMTYFMHGFWDGYVDHHAPLYSRDDESPSAMFLNVDFAINYWKELGAPVEKLILGVPFYGSSYTLTSSHQNEVGDAANGPGSPGKYTREPGFLAYYEVCQMINAESGWEVFEDERGNVYATKGNQWIGYDNVDALAIKMDYIKTNNLGGAMVWAVDLDDYRGQCGPMRWPLLSIINRILRPEKAALENRPPPTEAVVVDIDDDNKEEMPNGQDNVIPGAAGDSCMDRADGMYPISNQCGQYVTCAQNGQAFVSNCPAGLHFDAKTGSCNWPHLANCKESMVYSRKDSMCENMVDGLYSDPTNCQQMFWCTNQVQYRLSCPYGQHFDPSIGACSFYSRFRCLDNIHQQKSNHQVQPYSVMQPYLIPHITTFYPGGFSGLQLPATPTAYDKNKKKNVICYFSNWASYREEEGKFVPENIDPSLCSHIFYAFANLDTEKLEIISSSPSNDINSGFFNRVQSSVGNGNNNIKVILALGGWTDSGTNAYSRLVNDPEKRKNFVTKTVEFLKVYKFDGLSLDWQYPVCWQSNCRRGPASDKEGFTALVKELKSAMGKKLTLAASLSGYASVNEKAYDLNELGKYLDIVNVMTYDYHGFWDGETGHHSALKNYPEADPKYSKNNVESALNYMVGNGIPKEKLHMGIPLYGQSYELSTSNHGLGAPTRGKGQAGEYTLQRGMLAYYEICKEVTSFKWTKVAGTDQRGPYAYNKNQWVAYEDPESVAKKAQYILDNGYGGASLWTIDLDDFRNLCCRGPNPNINAASRILRGYGSELKPGDCQRPPPVSTPSPIPSGTTVWSDGGDYQEPSTSPKPEYPATPQTPATTAAPPPTQPPAALPVEPTGEGCITGSYLPHPTDCAKFLRCVQGKKELVSCPGGLFFDDTKNICDWKTNVDCNKRSGSPTGAEGPADPPLVGDEELVIDVVQGVPEKTDGDANSPVKKPSSCHNGEYKPVPGDCSSYYSCVEGESYLQKCAPGLHWVSSRNSCDWPENSDCTVKAKSFTKSAAVKGGDCANSNTLEVDPDTCRNFLQCNHGKWQSIPCQNNLVFNPNGYCDFEFNVECGSSGQQENLPNYPATTVATTAGTTQTTTTVATTTYPAPSGWPAEHDYKIVCYFTNWAWYRPEGGKYKPEHIDPNLCTHIVYGFAVLDYSNLLIKAHDGWADFDNEFYKKVTDFKKKGIKVTLAIGGWNDSQGDKYSRLVNNPSARAKFNKHVVDFILKHNFDGLDLDWEYPVCWQTECKENRKSDKQGFADWVSELKAAFKPHNLLLSAAVSPSKKIIDLGYDVPRIANDLDWIAVMSYDYHGHWDKKTGHVSPMYEHPEDSDKTFNTNFTIHHWLERGADKKKLVMGMPLYGQAFTLANAQNNGLNAPAPQKGQAGLFTRAAGFLAYYEVCEKIQQGYQVVEDPEGRMGPYAFQGNQWVGYDDIKMIKYKSEYIRRMGLGGGMIWALDLDDFNNRCGQGKHPLLSTIKGVLGPNIGQYPDVVDGSGLLTTPGSQGNQDSSSTGSQDASAGGNQEYPSGGNQESPSRGNQDSSSSNQDEGDSSIEVINASTDSENEYKVVCYFTNWAWYRQGAGKYKPEHIDPTLCTHIVYGFAVLNPNTLLIRPHDAWADLDNKFYEQVTALKNDKKKVLLAIGGWNDSKGDKYSRLVSNKATRDAFTEHVIEFLLKHNFDGLDLDWEYPVCWQVDCKKGPASDKENFALWIKEMHMAFKPHGLLLTAAVSPSKLVVDQGYDVPAASKYLDYISVMTYDYHGQWDKKTGHVAPMYHHPLNANEYFNVNYTVHYWIEKGLDRKKLIMGLPMYGQSFTLASSKKNGLQAASYGGAAAGKFTRARGFLSYYEICEKVQNGGWKVIKDPESRMGPYAFKGNQWVGFDDVGTIRMKTQYIVKNKLGGAMIWALDLDDFRDRCGCEKHPLLKTINRGLGFLKTKDPKCDMMGSFRLQENEGEFLAELPSAPYYKCTDGNFENNEEDCTMYKVCVNGEFLAQTCPSPLHWNTGTNSCDWPESAKCESNTIDDGSPVTKPTPVTPATPGTTKAPATTSRPEGGQGQGGTMVEPGNVPDTGYKVVCYFTNWAWYRPGHGKYTPEDIDPSLCTHVNYGFSVLDSSTLLMKPHDTWADLDNKFYEKVAALKDKGVKVLMALGGWNDSEGDKYSRMVNDANARKNFVRHAVEFIETHGFQGLDLDWEYPKCWQVNCDRGPASDKANFANLVKELSAEFRPRGWLLTAAVSPSKTVIDQGYDVPILSQYLDIINVMTYDYHGHWDKKTGHVAPLRDYEGSDYNYFNAEFTLDYYVKKGADPKKLVMGMPMYGQAFTLSNPNNNGLNAPAPSKGKQGDFTRAAGFLAYYEICPMVNNNEYTQVQHEKHAMGPYAFKGNQWVGYDDVDMIRRKSEFVKANGYGGGMIWALDLDDFNNVCNCEKYPLLKTINRVLRNYPSPDPQCKSPGNYIPGASVPYTTKVTTPFHVINSQLNSNPYQFIYQQEQTRLPFTGHYNAAKHQHHILYSHNILYRK